MPRAAAVLLAALLATVGALASSGAATADGKDHVVQVPVAFPVTVVNQGLTPCLGDAAPVKAVIRGTLTGPADAVEQATVPGAVFTHGDGYDETFNNFPDERYNVVKDLARRGHVSVTYDRLGYGDSDKPDGRTVCIGTEATVLHQIIEQLRAGSYQARGPAKPAFTRVASLGHSAGGFVVEQEAGRFGDVDALGAISTGLPASSALVIQRATEQQLRCANPRTSPNGYAGLEGTAEEFRADHIVNVEPKIADILTENRTKDACAGTLNIPNIAANSATNAATTIPVLLVTGTNDAFFPNVGVHAATFPLAQKTVKQVPETGHAIAFSRNAPLFRAIVEAWLTENRF